MTKYNSFKLELINMYNPSSPYSLKVLQAFVWRDGLEGDLDFLPISYSGCLSKINSCCILDALVIGLIAHGAYYYSIWGCITVLVTNFINFNVPSFQIKNN